jgi:hypothetical protein
MCDDQEHTIQQSAQTGDMRSEKTSGSKKKLRNLPLQREAVLHRKYEESGASSDSGEASLRNADTDSAGTDTDVGSISGESSEGSCEVIFGVQPNSDDKVSFPNGNSCAPDPIVVPTPSWGSKPCGDDLAAVMAYQ